MDSIDGQDLKQKSIRYGKYIIPLLIVAIIFFSTRSCHNEYGSIEDKMVSYAKDYVTSKNIFVGEESSVFVSILDLETISGTELCTKSSGVIVSRVNGNLKYQAYLKCDDYETNIASNKNKVIQLIGDELVVLNKGEVYKEELYTLSKDADVAISGSVGSSPGIYKIRYDAYVNNKLEETAYRIILVSAYDTEQTLTSLQNKSTPTINLEGDTDIYLRVGQKFSEPGYTAVDYTDGKISRKVKVDPNPKKLDNTRPATYVLVYSVTNSKGNTAVATRKVTFLENKSNVSIELTANTEEITNAVIINVKVTGSDFKRAYDPDRGFSTNYTYEVTSNGTYTFTVLDRYDNKISKQIEITNIDSIKPTGKCEALVHNAITDIDVDATDNKGIAGYTYIIDGKEEGFKKESTYKYNDSAVTASVRVKDIAGNETLVKCEMNKKEQQVTAIEQSDGSTEEVYKLVATKNPPLTFAGYVKSLNVFETSNYQKYRDHCLAFAYYHAYMLAKGNDITTMDAEDGWNYQKAGYFQGFTSDSKQVVLSKLYDLINQGEPVILQVNGNTQGTQRHYVTVIGYKNSVTSGDTITEKDLLIIDPYNGNLRRMDEATARFMTTGYETGYTYGYQLYILK